jgi:hypothetical protein
MAQCKPGTEEDFKSASLVNAQNSVQEVKNMVRLMAKRCDLIYYLVMKLMVAISRFIAIFMAL